MKKILSILAGFLLLIVGCGKSDSGSDTPTPPPTPQNVTVTTETLSGTWQLIEAETEGRKLSQSTDAEEKKSWACNKQGTIAFSATLMKITRYALDNGTCQKEDFYDKYVVENSKIYVFDKNNKKVYLFTASIVGDELTLSEDGKKDKLIYKKLSSQQPTAPAEKQAAAEVTVTGASPENVKVKVFEQIQERVFQEVAENDLVGGKVSIDVRKHIGKELYFVLKNKTNDEDVSERVKITIAEGKNTVSLAYAPKVYTASITVTRNNTPQPNVKVYALSGIEASSFRTFAATASINYNLYVQTVEKTFKTYALTNAQGIATFENLKPEYVNLMQYTFVVLTQTAPYYQSVQLNMNGTAQAGTISLSRSNNQGGGTNNKIPVGFNVYDTDYTPLENATVVVGGVSGKTDKEGYVEFRGEPNAAYDYQVVSECGEVKSGTIRTGVSSHQQYVTGFTPQEGTISITNNSNGSNPYTITIGTQTWRLEAGRTLGVKVKLGKQYQVEWKQISGYLFYPTTGSKTVSPTCQNKKVTVSFS